MPLLLLAYPFLELWSLLEFSAEAGALATIAYILLMIVLGYWLLQMAGRSALLTAGRFPSAAAIRGQLFAGEISVAFGAVLLMIPGLISDFLALYVFVRAALRAVFGGPGSRGGPGAAQPERDIPNHGPNHTPESSSNRGPVTLEGDYSRVDDD